MTLARDTEIQFAFLTLLALMGDHGGVFCFVFFKKRQTTFIPERSQADFSHIVVAILEKILRTEMRLIVFLLSVSSGWMHKRVMRCLNLHAEM